MLLTNAQSFRHGDWEPFLERFDFGVSVVMSETMRISLWLGLEASLDLLLC